MQLLGTVQSGHRPAIPDNSPQCIVQLIQNCWKKESLERPNISEISQQLQGYFMTTIVTLPQHGLKAL